MPDEPFIPPDPNEPLPPATGASDAGAGGELVTELDDAAVIEDGEDAPIPDLLAAAATGTPTWAQVYSLAKSQIAKWARGRKRENENDYTHWYYGNSTAAQFCFIFISWVLAHAGKSAAAGLALIGGKKAYVPYIRNISGYRSGHAGVHVGAIAAVSSFNHIGFVTHVGNTTFDLLSGNTVYENSDDAVEPKTYSLSSMSGYVNLRYAAASPNAYPGVVYKYTSGKAVMGGSRVKWIQQRLAAHKHAVSVDSRYGPKTAAAVKAFQSGAHLTADGQVGPKTWAALAK